MSGGIDEDSGRQDIGSPAPTLEKPDPTPVDIRRGQRMVLGATIVAIVFVMIAVLMVAT